MIFLHLPRTAGTTLNTIVERQYHRDGIFTFGGPKGRQIVEQFHAMSPTERTGISLLRGHMPFGLHELMPGDARYITIVREPVDRVISYYYYILRRPSHPLYSRITTEQMSLADCLREGMSKQFNNGQTRLLCGHDATVSVAYGQVTTAVLEQARRNLEQHFVVVGLTERFDETLLLLQRLLLWSTPLYTRANVTENRPPRHGVDAATHKLIEEYNALDLMLYEEVRATFDARVKAKGEPFQHDLQLFRLLNHRQPIAARF